MAAADMRVAAELLEYYRRAAYEAGALFPRQSASSPPSSAPAPTPTPTPTPPTPTPSTSPTSSTSSTSDTSSTSETSSNSESSTSNTETTPSSTPTTPPSRTSGTSSLPQDPTSTSARISSYVTTRLTTDANGQWVTTTEVVATVVPNPEANNNSSSVNTGAIVGGVVGGIAFIALLVGLFVWWRKRTRFDDFEANLFDPDRNVKRPMSTADPHSDLLTTAAVPEAARNITPYYPPAGSTTGTGAGTAQGSSVGWQPEARPRSSYYAYDNASSAGGAHYPPSAAGSDAFPNPYGGGYIPQSLIPGAMAAGVGAGGFGTAGLNRGPTVSSTTSSSYNPQSMYPPPHAQPTSPQFPQTYNQPMPVPMPVPTPSPPNARVAKEREAFQRTYGDGNGGWAVANQGADSSGSAGGENPVRQHQDGGRVNTQAEEGDVPRDAEIPPTYESIRHDNHDAPTPPV